MSDYEDLIIHLIGAIDTFLDEAEADLSSAIKRLREDNDAAKAASKWILEE